MSGIRVVGAMREHGKCGAARDGSDRCHPAFLSLYAQCRGKKATFRIQQPVLTHVGEKEKRHIGSESPRSPMPSEKSATGGRMSEKVTTAPSTSQRYIESGSARSPMSQKSKAIYRVRKREVTHAAKNEAIYRIRKSEVPHAAKKQSDKSNPKT